MKTISCLNDLKNYGFTLLTGEACNLGLRVVCDLNKKGLQLFCRAFGLQAPTDDKVFPVNWNCNGVASVMLGPSDWETIAVFALLDLAEVNAVWQCQFVGGRSVYYGFDEMKELLKDNGTMQEKIVGKQHYHWKAKWVMSSGELWPLLSAGTPIRRFAFQDNQPNDGDGRNIHQASGRTD